MRLFEYRILMPLTVSEIEVGQLYTVTTATLAETGLPGFDVGGWFGFSATGGTPEPVVSQLNGEFRKAIADPGVRQKLMAQGMDLTESSPAEFSAFIRSEIERWRKVVQATGAKVE